MVVLLQNIQINQLTTRNYPANLNLNYAEPSNEVIIPEDLDPSLPITIKENYESQFFLHCSGTQVWAHRPCRWPNMEYLPTRSYARLKLGLSPRELQLPTVGNPGLKIKKKKKKLKIRKWLITRDGSWWLSPQSCIRNLKRDGRERGFHAFGTNRFEVER